MLSAAGWLLLCASAGVMAGIPKAPATRSFREGTGLPRVNRSIAELGIVQGFVKKTFTEKRDVDCFLGIPYVEKPNRFEEPKFFHKSWDFRDVTERARSCPQGKFYPEELYAEQASRAGWTWEDSSYDVDGDDEELVDDETRENCLTLDVYTPSNAKADAKLPVLFFLHGGAFVRGASVSARPDFILDHDMELVIVSAQYRLGPLGFLATGGTKDGGKGNAGLHDQKWALDWTVKYISSFGGDPESIVVGGVSAGGATSGLLYVSPKTNSLLKGAMLFSGCSVSPWTIDPQPRRSSRGVAMYTVCETEAVKAAAAEEAEYLKTGTHNETLEAEDELFDCLQKRASVDELLNATWNWAKMEKKEERLGMGGTIPVLDGVNGLLPMMPADIILTHPNFKPLPILVGITREEGLYLQVQIDAFYIVQNSLMDDKKLLSERIGDIILRFAGVDDQLNTIGVAMQQQYFREEQLGNYPLMEDGVIDFTGAAFFKGPARKMVELNLQKGGKSWLYTFDYTSGPERENATRDGRKARSNHGSDQRFIFPAREANFVYTNEDENMALRFSRMVATFVTEQQPTPKGTTQVEGAEWPPLTEDDDDIYMAIGRDGWKTKRGFTQEYYVTNKATGLSAQTSALAATLAAIVSALSRSRV